MNKFNIIGLITIFLVFSGCSTSVNSESGKDSNSISFESEKEYLEEKGETKILYYKGAPFTGELVKYYDSKRIKSKEKYDEGKLQGKSYHYDSLGNLKNLMIYKDHKLIKKEINYYNKKDECVSKLIYPNGIDTTSYIFEVLYENGKPFNVQNYRNDTIRDAYQLHDNGDTINKSIFNKTGRLICSKDYFYNGNLYRILDYQKGMARYYHPSGKKNRELKLDSNYNVISGKYNYFDDAGSQFVLEYKNGRIVYGEKFDYYLNGNKKENIFYKNGEIVSFELFNPDGSLLRTNKDTKLDTAFYISGRIQWFTSKDIQSEDLCRRIYYDMPNSPMETMVYWDKDNVVTDIVYHDIYGNLNTSKSSFYSNGRKIRKPKLKEYVYHADLKGETNLDPGWSWKTEDTIYIQTKRNLLFVAHAYSDPSVKYMTAEELEYSTPPYIIDYVKNVLTGKVEQLSIDDKKEIEQRVKKQFLRKSMPEESEETAEADEWANQRGE